MAKQLGTRIEKGKNDNRNEDLLQPEEEQSVICLQFEKVQ
jgi:hypothetical protein